MRVCMFVCVHACTYVCSFVFTLACMERSNDLLGVGPGGHLRLGSPMHVSHAEHGESQAEASDKTASRALFAYNNIYNIQYNIVCICVKYYVIFSM